MRRIDQKGEPSFVLRAWEGFLFIAE